MDKIRVLLANYPMMVPDSIRRLVAKQEDMELVADCRGPMRILQETGRMKADAVIIGNATDSEPGLCSQLLAVYPDLTILDVSSNMDGYLPCSSVRIGSGWAGEHIWTSCK